MTFGRSQGLIVERNFGSLDVGPLITAGTPADTYSARATLISGGGTVADAFIIPQISVWGASAAAYWNLKFAIGPVAGTAVPAGAVNFYLPAGGFDNIGLPEPPLILTPAGAWTLWVAAAATVALATVNLALQFELLPNGAPYTILS